MHTACKTVRRHVLNILSASAMSEALPQVGIQTTCFDFPSHVIIDAISTSWWYRFGTEALGSSSGERGPGGQPAEHETAVHPGSRDGEQHSWQRKQEHRKQIQESDDCPRLGTRLICRCCIQFWSPQYSPCSWNISGPNWIKPWLI